MPVDGSGVEVTVGVAMKDAEYVWPDTLPAAKAARTPVMVPPSITI
jgi:hypothetical protein